MKTIHTLMLLVLTLPAVASETLTFTFQNTGTATFPGSSSYVSMSFYGGPGYQSGYPAIPPLAPGASTTVMVTLSYSGSPTVCNIQLGCGGYLSGVPITDSGGGNCTIVPVIQMNQAACTLTTNAGPCTTNVTLTAYNAMAYAVGFWVADPTSSLVGSTVIASAHTTVYPTLANMPCSDAAVLYSTPLATTTNICMSYANNTGYRVAYFITDVVTGQWGQEICEPGSYGTLCLTVPVGDGVALISRYINDGTPDGYTSGNGSSAPPNLGNDNPPLGAGSATTNTIWTPGGGLNTPGNTNPNPTGSYATGYSNAPIVWQNPDGTSVTNSNAILQEGFNAVVSQLRLNQAVESQGATNLGNLASSLSGLGALSALTNLSRGGGSSNVFVMNPVLSVTDSNTENYLQAMNQSLSNLVALNPFSSNLLVRFPTNLFLGTLTNTDVSADQSLTFISNALSGLDSSNVDLASETTQQGISNLFSQMLQTNIGLGGVLTNLLFQVVNSDQLLTNLVAQFPTNAAQQSSNQLTFAQGEQLVTNSAQLLGLFSDRLGTVITNQAQANAEMSWLNYTMSNFVAVLPSALSNNDQLPQVSNVWVRNWPTNNHPPLTNYATETTLAGISNLLGAPFVSSTNLGDGGLGAAIASQLSSNVDMLSGVTSSVSFTGETNVYDAQANSGSASTQLQGAESQLAAFIGEITAPDIDEDFGDAVLTFDFGPYVRGGAKPQALIAGGISTIIDFNPLHNPDIAPIFGFCKVLITWGLALFYMRRCASDAVKAIELCEMGRGVVVTGPTTKKTYT